MKRLNAEDIHKKLAALTTEQNNLYNSDGILNSYNDVLLSDEIEEKRNKLFKQLDYIRKRDKNIF